MKRNSLYAIDPNGAVRWTYHANAKMESLREGLSPDDLLVTESSRKGRISAIHAGAVRWTLEIEGSVGPMVLDRDGVLYGAIREMLSRVVRAIDSSEAVVEPGSRKAPGPRHG